VTVVAMNTTMKNTEIRDIHYKCQGSVSEPYGLLKLIVSRRDSQSARCAGHSVIAFQLMTYNIIVLRIRPFRESGEKE